MSDKEYSRIIEKIKVMPAETEKERDARWAWLQGQDYYDEFVTEIAVKMRPKAYEELKKRLSLKPVYSEDFDMVGGEYADKMINLDTVVLMEALRDVVQTYTGGGKKAGFTFFDCVKKRYNQICTKESGRNRKELEGIRLRSRPERIYYVLKLVKSAQHVIENTQNDQDVREVLRVCAQKESFHLSKDELTDALDCITSLSLISRLDSPLAEEESDKVLGDTLADPRNDYALIEDTRDWEAFFQLLTNGLENGWHAVKSAVGKRDRELIRAFLSKDILIVLKLKYLEEEQRKEYIGQLEPKCQQWCHRTRRCPITTKSKKGCYIRYGIMKEDTENGAEDIYEILMQNADLLYNYILQNAYVDSAFENPVGNLYDIYTGKLKPYDGSPGDIFQFTDAVLARSLGIKDKSKVSRAHTKYEKVTRKQLYKLFCRSNE